LVVSAVYSVNAKIGYGSLLKDDRSRSSKKSDIVRKSDLGIKTCSVNAALVSRMSVEGPSK